MPSHLRDRVSLQFFNELSGNKSEDDARYRKFLSLFGMLKDNVSPYSKRFLTSWQKKTNASYKSYAFLNDQRAYKRKYEDAWMAIVSFCIATNEPEEWKEDIPALATHWLESDKKAQRKLLNEKQCENLSKLVAYTIRKVPDFEGKINGFPLRKDKNDSQYTFIDLFAGIGGFRLGLENAGFRCDFSSEWNQQARETYYKNYGTWPFGDITHFTGDHEIEDIHGAIPEHDVLAGGFPCQPFSQAGQKMGFSDARGTLFFDIFKIAKKRRPAVLFLENVKGLRGHDGGRTFATIKRKLGEIDYQVHDAVLTAKDYGVPQNRQRIFIVAFRDNLMFKWPKPISCGDRKMLVGDILEKDTHDAFTISDRMWEGHQNRKKRNRAKGKGFGYSLFRKDAEYVNTISARYWKDGSEILIEQEGKNPRTLTPRECSNLQGFPKNFELHDSKKANYQQFGNSVAVPVIEAISTEILRSLKNNVKASMF